MKRLNKRMFVFSALFLLQSSLVTLSLAQAPAGAGNVERISIAELKGLLDAGSKVVIVDVRSKKSYDKGHLPKSISMPLADLTARHQELKNHPLLVLY